jgi:hypothetical protein
MWNRLLYAGNQIKDGEVEKAEAIGFYTHAAPLETINPIPLPQDIL